MADRAPAPPQTPSPPAALLEQLEAIASNPPEIPERIAVHPFYADSTAVSTYAQLIFYAGAPSL